MARNDFCSNYLAHSFLAHHGVLGMKWGIRRYQNPDGSLTDAGRARYGVKAGGSVDDISTEQGRKNRIKDLKKAIKLNQKKSAKHIAKTDRNPIKNALGINAKHASKVAEHSENIRKGEAEIKKLMEKNISKETDGAVIDERAHAAAKAAGLDQGDNWKVYRDAQAGDKKAQETIKQWESDKKVEGLPNDVTRDTYGFLNYKTKDKLPVMVNSNNDIETDKKNVEGSRKAAEYVGNKENLSKIKDQVVENMLKDDWIDASSAASKEKLKDNLRVYSMYVADVNGDTVYGEINCEHRNMSAGDSSPYGDHSIDVEFSYDTKKKKMSLSKYNSING